MAKTVITLRDLEALSERLLARGRSRMVESGLESDLLLAGKILTKWCRDGTDLGVPFSLDDD
jgi:hypothetical protein